MLDDADASTLGDIISETVQLAREKGIDCEGVFIQYDITADPPFSCWPYTETIDGMVVSAGFEEGVECHYTPENAVRDVLSRLRSMA